MFNKMKEGRVKINTDCVHFGGYFPCIFHKREGVMCENCPHYRKAGKKILIIKLGAAGEVIRCTPLIRKIKSEYPGAKIFWITDYPELVPNKEIFKVYKLNDKSKEVLRDIKFDIIYSLDKHEEMGAFANTLNSKIKKGFSHKDGNIVPFDKDAYHKFKTGIFDNLMKQNKKHYVEEIFEICGFKFNGEKYFLPEYEIPKINLNQRKKKILLNTGVGKGWRPRKYSKERWIELAKILKKNNYEVIIAGGPEEDQENQEIAKKSKTKYFGVFTYQQFIGLISLTDIVVTSVTFAFHVAVGLEKKILLLNNTFNKNEFFMYGNGVILEPRVSCLMCYKDNQDDKCELKKCMDNISPKNIFREIKKFK